MRYRHRVLGMLFLLSIITYLDRVCISVAGPRMQQDLGLSPSFYRAAVRHARELRDRYSILDLAADAGVLEALMAEEG